MEKFFQFFRRMLGHSISVGLLDLFIDFLTVDGHLARSTYTQLDLVTLYLEDRQLDIIIDDQRFAFLSR